MEAKRKYCFEETLNDAIDDDRNIKDNGFKKE